MRRCLPVLFLLLAAPASAQTITIQPRPQPTGSASNVRIQVQMQLFTPAKADDTIEDQRKAQEAMRLSFYQMAAHECAVIVQALPGDCRMTSLNVSSNAMQRFNTAAGGITGNANASFEVTLKAAP